MQQQIDDKNFGSKTIRDKYKILEKKGEGTYGVVYRCQDLKNPYIFVAIKRIKLDIGSDDEGVPSTTLREISILQKAKHKNLVELLYLDYTLTEQKLFLIFEYIDFDLKQYIELHIQNLNGQQLLEDIKRIIYQILKGIDYLHKNRILHRDLKPANILISKQKEIKIADFGLSRTFSLPQGKFTKEISTLWYRAPELMLGDDNYSISVDLWAVGCIMAELLLKKPVFDANSQIDQLFTIFETLGTPTDQNYKGVSKLPDFKFNFPKFQAKGLKSLFGNIHIDNQYIDLLSKLLALYPCDRPTAKEALEHPFFDQIKQQYQ